MYYSICYIFVLTFKISGFISLRADLIENVNDYQTCICVPYWQCKEDYSGFIEDSDDGVDIMDTRKTIKNPTNSCTGDFDVCCQIECGRKRNKNFNNRKLKPRENFAEFAEFPWMLGVIFERSYRCGASLIHPKVALTAAHCVSLSGSYKIRAGEFDWQNKNEPLPHHDRTIQKIIVHKDFDATSLQNDIALAILEKPFLLSENVGIACIPHSYSSFYNNDIRKCTATGWGKNSYRKPTYEPILKKLQLPLVPRNKCLIFLQQARFGLFFQLHPSFICAGGENRDTCKGDGGSPLICASANRVDRYEQVGIVSWGLTCGFSNTPGVYVNVAIFSGWIDEQMGLHGFDTEIYRM